MVVRSTVGQSQVPSSHNRGKLAHILQNECMSGSALKSSPVVSQNHTYYEDFNRLVSTYGFPSATLSAPKCYGASSLGAVLLATREARSASAAQRTCVL